MADTAADAPPARDASDPLIGQTVGRYVVTDLVGIGGTGRVYLAEQPEIGGRVAIKVLSPALAEEREAVDRFFAEARAVNLIRHEAIVQVLDLDFLDGGRPYIVMEYLEGAPLSALIARRGPLPLAGLVAWARQVLDAVGAAHARGIIHRDLKPQNLWVTPSGRARVLDFGLAKLAPELDARGLSTRSGLLLGTPHYMAPEQANARPVDARADIYALGVVLYEAVTGVRPFEAASLFELLRQHLEDTPVPPRERRGDVPPALDRLIRRALEKSPDKRFADAAAMSAALAEVERGLGPVEDGPLRPPGPGDTVVDPQAPTVASPTPARRSQVSGRVPLSLRRAAVVAGVIALGGVAIALARTWLREPMAQTAALAASDAAVALAADGPADAAVALAAADAAAPPAPAAAPPAAAVAVAKSPRTRAEREASPPGDAGLPREARAEKRADAGAGGNGGGPTIVPPEPPPPGMTQEQYEWRKGVERRVPGPADPAHFDLVAFMPEARKLARDIFPDADLVMMYASKVPPSGIMDLAGDGGSVGYMFRTRTMEGQDARCYVMVNVYAKVIEVQARLPTNPGDRCEWTIAPAPRCSAADVWKLALAQPDAKPDGRAYVRYLVRKGARVWEFAQLGGGPDFKATDDCP